MNILTIQQSKAVKQSNSNMNRQITIAICLLSVLLLGALLIWPEYKELQERRAGVVQKERELQGLKEYLSGLNTLNKEIEMYKVEFSKVDSALPSEFFLPSFLNYIQKTASENGLILTSFSNVTSNSLKEESDIKESHLSLGLSGSYSAFKSFLSTGLEKSARLIEVEKISFSSPGSSPEGEEKPFSFSIGIKVYSY